MLPDGLADAERMCLFYAPTGPAAPVASVCWLRISGAAAVRAGYYIFSGALTPSNSRPLRRVCPTARSKASRASVVGISFSRMT